MQVIKCFAAENMIELCDEINEYAEESGFKVYTMNTIYKGSSFYEPIQCIVVFNKEV